MQRRLCFGLIALLTLVLSSCDGSPYYTSEPFTAQIVDADTKRPIDGAIVLAHWRLYESKWFDSSTPGAELEVMETVTDVAGRFQIKGFTKLNPTMQALRDEDPALIVYARGYYPGFFRNSYPINDIASLGPTRKSELSGQSLKLIRWDNDKERMITRFIRIRSDLDQVVSSCMWIKAPLFFSALFLEAKRIDAGKPSTAYSFMGSRSTTKAAARVQSALRGHQNEPVEQHSDNNCPICLARTARTGI